MLIIGPMLVKEDLARNGRTTQLIKRVSLRKSHDVIETTYSRRRKLVLNLDRILPTQEWRETDNNGYLKKGKKGKTLFPNYKYKRVKIQYASIEVGKYLRWAGHENLDQIRSRLDHDFLFFYQKIRIGSDHDIFQTN